MPHCVINFRYEEQSWSRSYRVPDGATIMHLKEKILEPRSNPKGLVSFQLCQRGLRVSDLERIPADQVFEFEFLGPEEGARRAKLDLERQDREATVDEADAASGKKSSKPVPVAVSVRNPAEGMESKIEVWVMSNATISDLRSAVMAAMGENDRDKVNIVRRIGGSGTGGFIPILDREKIGAGRESLCLGRKLTLASSADGSLKITVALDREHSLLVDFSVPRGTTIHKFKELMCAKDPSGASKPDSYGLGYPGDPTYALPDALILEERHALLYIAELKEEELRLLRSKPPGEDAVWEDVPPKRLWKVVGGAGVGGILVRKGFATSSQQLTDRLSKGAIVEEIVLDAERLSYKKISGTGPDEGWVSLSIAGKELMAPATAQEAFSADRALALQVELYEGFSTEEFQAKLQSLHAEYPQGGVDYLRKRSALLLGVQREVLPKYGFEGSSRGAVSMLSAFNLHDDNPQVGVLGAKLTSLIDFPKAS